MSKTSSPAPTPEKPPVVKGIHFSFANVTSALALCFALLALIVAACSGGHNEHRGYHDGFGGPSQGMMQERGGPGQGMMQERGGPGHGGTLPQSDSISSLNGR